MTSTIRPRTLAVALLFCAAATLPFAAEERINGDLNARIREEGMNKSQVMRTLHFLADVYGPRVTGSPSLKAAGEWAVKTMEGWGMKNGRLEPWAFGHPGWANELAWGAITAPVKDTLVLEVLAWTPGTKGAVKGTAVNIVIPEQPTPEELAAYFASVKRPREGGRRARRAAAGRAGEHHASCQAAGGRGRQGPVRPEQPELRARTRRPARRRTRPAGDRSRAPSRRASCGRRIDSFSSRAARSSRVNDAGREHGQIIAFNNDTYDLTKAVPTVVVRNEDYGRIARILADGTPVELEFNIVNKVYPEGRTAYNTIAEIPGSDKADEVVMLGGHLDSWHSATGATDNAIGCAIMMEAARILKTLGVAAAPDDPRRALERRGRRAARLARVREGALRLVRGAEAGVEQAGGVPEHRHGDGPAARRERVRPARGRRHDARDPRPVPGPRHLRRGAVDEPHGRRHRQHVVQQRRPPRHRLPAGSDRVQLPHPSHEPRHLRTGHRGRREEGGGDRRLGDLSPVDARRDAAAVRAGRHARAAGAAG